MQNSRVSDVIALEEGFGATQSKLKNQQTSVSKVYEFEDFTVVKLSQCWEREDDIEAPTTGLQEPEAELPPVLPPASPDIELDEEALECRFLQPLFDDLESQSAEFQGSQEPEVERSPELPQAVPMTLALPEDFDEGSFQCDFLLRGP